MGRHTGTFSHKTSCSRLDFIVGSGPGDPGPEAETGPSCGWHRRKPAVFSETLFLRPCRLRASTGRLEGVIGAHRQGAGGTLGKGTWRDKLPRGHVLGCASSLGRCWDAWHKAGVKAPRGDVRFGPGLPGGAVGSPCLCPCCPMACNSHPALGLLPACPLPCPLQGLLRPLRVGQRLFTSCTRSRCPELPQPALPRLYIYPLFSNSP